MSLSRPSHVSPATGSAQNDVPNGSTLTAVRMIPSWTTPTLWVFVIPIDPGQEARLADPLEAGQLAVAVQPVAARIDGLREDVAIVRHDDGHAGSDGPAPTTSGPSPRTIVAWPTRTPGTSVIAFAGPGSAAPDDDPEIPRSNQFASSFAPISASRL